MNRLELFINGSEVDINEPRDFGLRINKIVSDSNDLSKRGGVYTFTVKVPKTDKNNKVFGFANVYEQTSKFNLNENIEVEIYINGYNILNGTFLISRITKENYEGVIYGQDISWINQMEGKSIRDIESFPSKPFEGVYSDNGYSIEDYRDRVLSRDENDICFPILGYGNFFDGNYIEGEPLNAINELTFEELPAGVFYKSILDNLFKDYGYAVSGEIFNTTIFEDYFLPFVGDEFIWNWGTLANLIGQTNSDIVEVGAGGNYDYLTNLLPSGIPSYEYKYVVKNVGDLKIEKDYFNDGNLEKFVTRFESIYDLSLIANYINNNYTGSGITGSEGSKFNIKFRILLVKNHNDDLTTEEIEGSVSNPNIILNDIGAERINDGGVFLKDYNIFGQSVNDLDLEIGDTISVVICVLDQLYTPLVGSPQTYTINFDYFNYKLDVLTQEGTEEINPAINLPDISQKDFVKGFLNTYNLFFRYNADTRTLTFTDKTVFYREPELCVNLDDACDIKDFEILPISIPAKESYLWNNDEDDFYINQDLEYCNTEIINSNIYAKGESVVLLPYSATKLREYDFIYPTGGLAELPSIAGYDEVNQLLNEVEKNYDFKPRLLRLKRFQESAMRFTLNGNVVLWHSAVFGNEWSDSYFEGFGFYTYWRKATQNNSNLIKGKAWLTQEQWRLLVDNYNVELGNDRYKIEEIGAYDPQRENPTQLTLLKEV